MIRVTKMKRIGVKWKIYTMESLTPIIIKAKRRHEALAKLALRMMPKEVRKRR